jgi:WD40 repeat protein
MKNKSSNLGVTTGVLFQCGWLAAAASAAPLDSPSVRAPDAAHFAEVAASGRIHYLRASDGGLEKTFYLCNAETLEFSAEGQFLAAAGGREGTRAKIKVWRVADGSQLGEIVVAGDGVRRLAVSADGSLVMGASADGRVDAWSVADGKQRWSRTFSSAVQAMRISADGSLLIVKSADGTERLIDLAHGRNARRGKSAKVKPRHR